MTGPVARFARQIAGQGYIVAAPSSYHEFTGPEPLAYDVPGTDSGNEWKVKKVRDSLALVESMRRLCALQETTTMLAIAAPSPHSASRHSVNTCNANHNRP